MPDAIGALTSPQQMGLHGSVDSAMSALGGMDSEGFLKLLVAQLKYQSPMDPQDPGDLMTQTAALAQLDATQQLLQIQQRNMGLQQAVAASNLLGTEVTGIGPEGDPVSGMVESVRYTPAGPMLTVNGVEVAYSQLTELRHSPGEVIAHPPNLPDGTPGTWDGPLWSPPAPGSDQPTTDQPTADGPAADAPVADAPPADDDPEGDAQDTPGVDPGQAVAAPVEEEALGVA